jgi:stage II sporulation protein D
MSRERRHVTVVRASATALVAAVSLALAQAAVAASTFFVRGGGNGHGIGMSQYGAYGYALHGKSYQFILAHYYQGTTLGHTHPNQTVRVLLYTGSAVFSGATAAAGTSLNPSANYTVDAISSSELAVYDQSGKRVATSSAPLTATGPGAVTAVGLGQYRGDLEFRPNGFGGVETINALGLDDYVRGVIAAEMPASWSQQALDAQAVAARTYAITTSVSGNGFTLYPDTRSQMYDGVRAETASTNAAVAATSGQIVSYGGRPVATYFFSSSGGHTEDVQNVWPGATPEPWLRGVPDPYDNAGGDPYHQWGSQMSVAAAAAKLATWVKGSLVGIRVTKSGASPRILTAQVVGTRGSVNVTGLQLQHAFGLLTTYASFTTISSTATSGAAVSGTGSGQGGSGQAGSGQSGSGASGLPNLLVPVSPALAGPNHELTGTVFPATAGASVAVQGTNGSTVGTVRLSASGQYTVAVPRAGTYRIACAGLAGPWVKVP